jgi:hypothetical protein
VFWAGGLVFLLASTGGALLIDGWERRRVDLADRLRPYLPQTIGEEVEAWLRSSTEGD